MTNYSRRFPCFTVAVGASAGGHEALFGFFDNIPATPNIAIVVLMHLQRNYESRLDLLISKHTRLQVIKVKGNETIRPNVVYVLPENKHMKISNGKLILKERPLHEIENKAIDVFFESLGNEVKEYSLGIIFSGLGTDGSKGISVIENNGGTIIVQNPDSALYKNMPEAAIASDNPEYISTPANIGRNLMDIIENKKKRIGIENLQKTDEHP